jgi:hypothetical protein
VNADQPRTSVANAPIRSPVAWRTIAIQASLVWLATRVLLIATTYFTVVLNLGSRTSKGYVVGTHSLADLGSAWVQWDAYWYIRIAEHGYYSQQSTAFFPLYPLLVHLATLPFGPSSTTAAAMVVSNLAAWAAFTAIGWLAASELGPQDSEGPIRTMILLAAFPLAFFMAAAYSESLFIALAALTLLSARRGYWYWAAAAAFGAALTRPVGAILILPLAIELLRQQPWRRHSRLIPALTSLGAVPLAIAAFMALQWQFFNNPILFLEVQSRFWQRRALPPWQTAQAIWDHLVHNPTLGDWQALLVLDLGLFSGMMVITLIAARSQPRAFTAYSAALLISCIVTPNLSNLNPVSSAGRFVIGMLPAFLFLGQTGRRRTGLQAILIGGGFMLQGVLLTLYLSGAWLE